ncbi:MAG: hypothetical protein KDK29_11565 [Sedimentitalea sp.]|nr:hypothetical protein [Sedimentitalea sp.]
MKTSLFMVNGILRTLPFKTCPFIARRREKCQSDPHRAPAISPIAPSLGLGQ